MIATRLGPYEISGKLGEGGMGEVYRATDSRLKREVAIKVLPAAFTADRERVARFEREAQLLAQLQHPNIAAIHGIEESAGTLALVMELVDGEDLSARIARGPLPVEEALSIARQIAEALEAAHERGIVHRDLKPQNVKVRADGTVKVLDFGLAKAMDDAAPASAGAAADLARSPTLMHSPTLTAVHGTQLGVILGTAAYMAPEQARGGAVDKRADIWAFGVVLHEMLTGRSLFAAETVSDTLAGVLKSDIHLEALPAATPRAVRRLLRWCLERNSRNRLHDIADARLLLDEAVAAPADDQAAATPTTSPSWPRWAAVLLALFGVGALAGAVVLVARRAPGAASAPTIRVRLLPTTHGTVEDAPAIAPDGRSMVFPLVGDDGLPHLASYSFDSGATRVLPATEHADEPFWSPDGRWIGFFAGGQLSKLELSTGLMQQIAPASDPRGGCWSDSGDIFFTPNSSSALFRVPAAGGKPTRATQLDPGNGEQSHRFPVCLPGGKAIVYLVLADKPGTGLVWRSLRDGAKRRLTGDLSRAAYDPRGYLLWVRQSALVAQRFDPDRGELRGDPARIGEDQVGVDTQRAGFGWFDTAGEVIAMRSSRDLSVELRWFDRAGKPLEAVTSPGFYSEPMLSPDGARVAATVGQGGPTGFIWVYATDAKDRGTRITFDNAGGSSTAAWLDGGRSIGYTFSDRAGYKLGRRAADGSGSIETLWAGPHQSFIDDVTEHPPRAVLEIYDADGGVDLWLMPLTGDRRPQRFGAGGAASRAHAAFSPDGSLVAFASDESGLSQVYVAEVDAPASRWQVTSDGGDLPTWRPDGKELYWVGMDRVLRAAPVQALAPFAVGAATPLFRLRLPFLSLTGNHSFYAPSRDGQRFLVRSWIGEESEPGFLVTMNWRPPTAGAR